MRMGKDRCVGSSKTDKSRLLLHFLLRLLIPLACLCACQPSGDQTGGEIIPTPDREDDPTVLSPPLILKPLLACGTAVTVKGFIPGSQIDIFADGSLIGGGIGLDPEKETYPVTALIAGQSVTATQTFDSFTSDPSDPVVVKDHTEVYPNGLPRPGFPALYLYDCGVATVVDRLPPGGTVRVMARDPIAGATPSVVGQVSGVEERQTVGN